MKVSKDNLVRTLDILRDKPDATEITGQWHNPTTLERVCLTLGDLRSLNGMLDDLRSSNKLV